MHKICSNPFFLVYKGYDSDWQLPWQDDCFRMSRLFLDGNFLAYSFGKKSRTANQNRGPEFVHVFCFGF